MIADPITLGVTSHVDVFDVTELGPGSKTLRRAQSVTLIGGTYTFPGLQLTISHDMNKKTERTRSLFRLDFSQKTENTTIGSVNEEQPPAAYLVVDRSNKSLSGDTEYACKELLSRILGFLSANATGAPDHTFATQTKVIEFLRGEP